MEALLLRPYYGININSDMNGDLGSVERQEQLFPDMSFVYAAAILDNSPAVAAHIIDANAEKLMPEELVKRLWSSYNFIFLKICLPTINEDIKLAKELRILYPKATIVLGGHVVRLLEVWLKRHYPQFTLASEYRLDQFIARLFNQPALLNAYPSIDYSLLPFEQYKDVSGELRACLYLNMGCYANCNYCPYAGFFRGQVESRGIEQAINDIKGMVSLGFKTIQFRDQFFTANRDQVVKLCNMLIDQDIKIKWRCETRIETLDASLIDLMVHAGLEMICFGVESASKEILKQMNRATSHNNRIRDAVELLKSRGVITCAFYMIGLPAETWDDVKKTYELSEFINSTHAQYSCFFPYNIYQEKKSQLTPSYFLLHSCHAKEQLTQALDLNQLKFAEAFFSLKYSERIFGLEDTYWYTYRAMVQKNAMCEVPKNV